MEPYSGDSGMCPGKWAGILYIKTFLFMSKEKTFVKKIILKIEREDKYEDIKRNK